MPRNEQEWKGGKEGRKGKGKEGKASMWKCDELQAQVSWLTAATRPINNQATFPSLCINKYYDSFDINPPLPFHIHLRSLTHPHPLLQKLAEIPNRAILPHRTVGILIIPDLRKGAEPAPEPHQFFELAHLIRKECLDEVEQLVYHKIYDCDVVEIPACLGTVVFVIPEHWLYLDPPVIAQTFLFLGRKRGPRRADEGEDGISEVQLTSDAVYLDLVGQRSAEEIASAHLFDHVVNRRSRPGHDEIPVFEEGQVLDDPGLGLIVLELGPLVRCKVRINIGYMQILADQPANLDLSSKRVVTDRQRLGLRLLLSFVGTHGLSLFNLYIFYLFRLGLLFYTHLLSLILGFCWQGRERSKFELLGKEQV